MALKGISFPFRKADGQFPKIDEDADAVRSNILALFNLPQGGRVMRPTLGTTVHSLVFESQGDVLTARLRRAIWNTVAEGEPRAKILNIDIRYEGSLVTAEILYEVTGVQQVVQVAIGQG